MSATAFQNALARLVADPDFRDAVRQRGSVALGADLTDRERRRLAWVAGDRGLDITRTLHKGFRYGKLRALLPLTCVALGTRLAGEIDGFWGARVCQSLYYIDEALAFCEHLERRMDSGLRLPYLRETVAYERAGLDLQRPGRDAPGEAVVRFRHDPVLLLSTLTRGQRPRGIPVRPSTLIGSLAAAGDLEWRIVEHAKPSRAGDGSRRPGTT